MSQETASKPAACAIAVMAKAPRAGQVKTRLVPPLDHEMACELSASFLRDITTNIALAARECSLAGYAAYAPVGFEHLFDGVLYPGTGLILADTSGDMPLKVEGFGRCLLNAARSLFARGHEAACLLNSDSPTLPTGILVETTRALALPGDRVVLGAAEDGGYYLIGMKAPHAELFANIKWSTDCVADQTRARAHSLGLEVVELPVWYDVDDEGALRRLLGDLDSARPWRSIGYHAPATAACIDRLELYRRLNTVVIKPTPVAASLNAVSEGSA